MAEPADRFRDAVDDFWDEGASEEAYSTDTSSIARPNGHSPKHSGLAVLLMALGLYLIAALGLKVWTLYNHTYEEVSGAIVKPDLATWLMVAPDLEMDLTTNARASSGVSSTSPQTELAPSERPEFHIVSPSSSLPREHDALLGTVGFLCVLVGLRSLARHRLRRIIAWPDAVTRRSAGSWIMVTVRAAIAAWGFFEILLIGAVALLLLTLAHHLVLSVIGGMPLSWELVDQTIDQIVSVAWP